MNNLAVVERGSLVEYQEGLIAEQEAAVRMADSILQAAAAKGLPAPKECLKTKEKGEARLKALRAGFLPTVGLQTVAVPKGPIRKRGRYYSWLQNQQRRILRIIKELPPEVHQAIDEAKSLELFDTLAVSRPGGDPVIVGQAGGWKFLIASWVNLMDGQGIGFRFRLPGGK